MVAMAGSEHSQFFMMSRQLPDCTRFQCIELPLMFVKGSVATFPSMLHVTQELYVVLLELPVLAGGLGNLEFALVQFMIPIN